MSEQDGAQSSTKQRRSRKTNIANQDNGKQAPTVKRPAIDDTEAWKAYWEEQGQEWRTEPEIDTERQKFLAEQRSITPDIEKGIYPFRDIKLKRADVEWLLATHENGLGPVKWGNGNQEERIGLDLRGADLRRADLHDLPLTAMWGGLSWFEGIELNVRLTDELRQIAMVHLERADLSYAHLEGADLEGAHLENAYLDMSDLQYAKLNDVHLENASLREVNLEKADVSEAHLQRAQLESASLEGCKLTFSHLEGADLNDAHLAEAILHNVFFDSSTFLDNIQLGDTRIASLCDIHWGDVNLSVVNWAKVTMLGDEQEARQKRYDENGLDRGKIKESQVRFNLYSRAVRANRQLAVALQEQGLNEEADHFAYRAQLLQRVVWRYQRRWLKYILSWFLYLVAGYGYRPGRTLSWYFVIIFGFATAYYIFGHLPALPDTLVFSLTSFHGRGFFPSLSGETNLHNPLVVLAAIEAVIGLFIEISFIATFTQRFFGK